MWDRIIRWMALIGVFSLGSVLAIACARGPVTQSAEEFYRGKTITWIGGGGAGGSTDLVTRVIAPYLAKETGAKVVIDNMTSDETPNAVFDAQKDGLMLASNVTAGVLANDILKAPGVMYETDKLNFLADQSPSSKVFQVSPKLPYKTIEELRKAKGLKAGATSTKGQLALSGAVMFEMLGLDGKVITGYSGTAPLRNALTHGEVDIIVTSDNRGTQLERDGVLKNFFVINDQRSPAIPDVPTLLELGVKAPPELQAAREFILLSGQAVFTTPDIPKDRVEYLRKVFLKLNDNKDLQNDLERLNGQWVPFASGKELQDQMIAIKAKKDLAAQLDTIFNKYKATQ